MTMRKDYEGLPAARNIQESIIQAQLSDREGPGTAEAVSPAVQLLIDSVIDSVTRIAA
jgi:hypothetical protein